MKPVLCAAAVALVPAMAATPSLAQGSIEGDVYLVMQSGDVRKMAASRVHLISQEAARRMAPLCEARDSATAHYLHQSTTPAEARATSIFCSAKRTRAEAPASLYPSAAFR